MHQFVWMNYDSYSRLQVSALLSHCGVYECMLLQLYPSFLHISHRSLRWGGPFSGPFALCSGLRVWGRTMMRHVMHSWPIPPSCFHWTMCGHTAGTCTPQTFSSGGSGRHGWCIMGDVVLVTAFLGHGAVCQLNGPLCMS